MIDELAESHLQYFRDRVSVKGNSTKDRAKYILDRWEKVLEDCEKSNDHSPYRILFANTHKEPAENLRGLLDRNLEEEDLFKHIRMLKYKFSNLLKTNRKDAATDALCYIVLELEATGVISNV